MMQGQLIVQTQLIQGLGDLATTIAEEAKKDRAESKLERQQYAAQMQQQAAQIQALLTALLAKK